MTGAERGTNCRSSSIGRALAFQAGGCGFEARLLLKVKIVACSEGSQANYHPVKRFWVKMRN